MAELYANPTLAYAMRMEVREKKCGCCTRGQEVIRGTFICTNNKKFPACKRERNGFEYSEGEA